MLRIVADFEPDKMTRKRARRASEESRFTTENNVLLFM